MVEGLALNACVIGGLMLALWLLSVVKRDASVVDAWWGPLFLVSALCSLSQVPTLGPRAWLMLGMVGVWGVRLGGWLAWRDRGRPEDFRYRAMRSRWGPAFPWVSLGVVFAFQGALVLLVGLPVTMGVATDGPLSRADAVGAGLWALGMVFEAGGDWQLARFRADPRNAGGVLDKGLWRYTRHPNYFGDFCVWWGLWIVAGSGGVGPDSVAGPLVMSVLLVQVSGVPLLERTIGQRRPAYAEYVRRTSTFFPWFPRD